MRTKLDDTGPSARLEWGGLDPMGQSGHWLPVPAAWPKSHSGEHGRFNFRGVGRSEGGYGNAIGESADARAAVAFLREQTATDAVSLAEYSFGAMVALQAGHNDPGAERLIAVAPPLSFFDLAFARACRKPKLLLAGDRDSYCSVEALRRGAESLPQPTGWKIIAGADHFFARYEDEVGETVADFVCGREPEA